MMRIGIEQYGFAGTHWALGGLVLVALAASEYSGAGILVALPISAVGISFAALSGFTNGEKSLSRKKHCSDFIDFLDVWLDILEHLMSAATCARVASATVDYMSQGRLRQWLFGLETHSLGEPWPDVLGISIVAIVTTLFMLGLEKSSSFCILLFLGIITSFTFFVSVGGYHTDIIFWNWSEDFRKRSWGCILTTAAMCSFGFANSFPSALMVKPMKIAAFVIIPLICYSVIALVFTLMSHYRELAGIAIPLVRVFEVRDVDWARPVMAVCTICVVCLALTEIMPSLYSLLVRLAGRDWRLLVSPILYRNSLTGAPVLAIFTAGSLASILAFACPLSYLLRLMNVACLFKCALKSSTALYGRYKPENNNLEIPVSSNIQYSMLKPTRKLQQQQQHQKIRKSRTFCDMLPAYLRKNKATVSASELRSKRSRKSPSGDKEYLLLDHYSTSSLDHLAIDTCSDSDVNEMSPNCSDGEESSSSTDIDAVVQEYKDRIQVATVNNFNEKRCPTLLTSRVVLCLIIVLYISSVLLSLGITINSLYLSWSNIIVSTLCLLGICVMPQNTSNKEEAIKSPIWFPWFCFVAIIINVLLGTTLLIEIWPAVVLWIISGLMLYSRCSCCSCFDEDKEPIRISSKTECSIADPSNSTATKYIEVDTILIPR
ncbi:PREDICTED: high affinity cationic amino acid transporter 1 isoform X2 [Nicrophorus vespilloides]|uniref:High affinity cationic amino acid transporter 1 isoform X2 n=1 Tax=Nicrophorus vespilloides TaxID=110193 RepID=A0ABM1MMP7_NICVS|nr:PREDICTED: high affinity cationic amino acid transporter 1 isoform X2 [Nicrophorus vespilloides]